MTPVGVVSIADEFMDDLRAIGPVEWFRHSVGLDLRHLDAPLFVWRFVPEAPELVGRLGTALRSFARTVAWDWGRHERRILDGANWWLTLREVRQIQDQRRLATDSEARAALAAEQPGYVREAWMELPAFGSHIRTVMSPTTG